MKKLLSLTLVAALMATVSAARAEDKIESGLQPGKLIGAFYVTKCAGAEKDGVKTGENLCYRCKYGQQPQVIVFTRTTNKKLEKLVKKLDAAVKKHSDKELAAFVSLLGEDKDALSAQAKKFAKTTNAKSVPFVVPNESENGPENYRINPKAEVTVILAKGGEVKANHAFASAKKVKVEAVLDDISKILN